MKSRENKTNGKLVDLVLQLDQEFRTSGISHQLQLSDSSIKGSQELSGLSPDELHELEDAKAVLQFLDCVRNDLHHLEEMPSESRAPDSTLKDFATRPRANRETETIQKLGRFEVRELVGQGGFAKVFLARDPLLNRDVALKVPKMDILLSEESRIRFQREAKAAALLSHPAIVPVYESGLDGPIAYIASGYCQGQTLAEFFSEQDRVIDPRSSAKIVARLAEAVEHAHIRGIIHRDLKPANILLEDGETEFSDRVRITDFGLAKQLDSNDSTLTLEGAIVGTPAYMSPEQARGSDQVGTSTDIYSLGTILYELLTGELPFKRSNHLATFKAIENEGVKSPRKHNPEIDQDLAAICLKCLEKQPSNRYSSAFKLSEDLNAWLDSRSVMARPVSHSKAFFRWCQRNPALAAAISFAFLSLSIGFSLATWQWQVANGKTKHLEVQTVAAKEQAERANRNLNRVEDVINELLSDTAVSLQHSPGLSSLRSRILNRVLELQKELLEEESRSGQVTLRTLVAYNRLATVHSLAGEMAESLSLLQRAEELYCEIPLENLTGDIRKIRIMMLLSRIDNFLNGGNLHGDSMRLLATAFEAIDELDFGENANAGELSLMFDAHYMRARAYSENQMQELSREDYLKCIEIAESSEGEFHGESRYKLAKVYNSLAIMFRQTGRKDEARDNYLKASILLEPLIELKPDRFDMQKDYSAIQANLGNLFFEAKEWQVAAEHYQAAAGPAELLTIMFKEEQQPRKVLISSLVGSATANGKLGEHLKAKQGFERALDEVEQLNEGTTKTITRVKILNNFGILLRFRFDDKEAAEKMWTEVVTCCLDLLSSSPNNFELNASLSSAYHNLAKVKLKQNQLEPALDYAKKLDSLDKQRFSNMPATPRIKKFLAENRDLVCRILMKLGRDDEAKAVADED